MKVYLDDERPTPPGWVEAIRRHSPAGYHLQTIYPLPS